MRTPGREAGGPGPSRWSWIHGVRRAATALVAAGALAGCGDGTGPDPEELEVLPLAGDGAVAPPGATVVLEARVVRAADAAPRPGVEVLWTVQSGDASLPGGGVSVSDEEGRVSAALLLGGTPGPVAVRARAGGATGEGAVFDVRVAERPRLDGVEPGTAAAGASVTLAGADFLPAPGSNVVLFSGIRGAVLEASPERLVVEVPPCLAAGPVEVTVRFGSLTSESRGLDVAPGGPPHALAPGEHVDLDDPAAPACLRAPGDAEYLLLPASVGTVGAARWDVTLRGRVRTGAADGARARAGEALRGPALPRAPSAARLEAEAKIRALEAAVVRRRAPVPPTVPVPVPAPVPVAGDVREFSVLNVDRAFDQVRATARWVGERAAVYVDESAPADGLGEADLAALGRTFDDAIHPAVTAAFGEAGDLDGNGRVVVLLTPTVNRHTARGADGFIGGFFYGVDLLPDQGGSNAGEILYAAVPDPAGVHSDPRSVERILEVVPAVLAHEFQHMIHFHERIVERAAATTEALWLSEGMAQMAEEIVARSYEARDEGSGVRAFREGNAVRARRYLADPASASLLFAGGPGTLAERGGAWLFVLYLADQLGEEVLASLTATTRTGVRNVEAVTGRGWDELLPDWWTALHAEGSSPPPTPDPRLRYPGVDLRALVEEEGPWPLRPEVVGGTDFLRAGSLESSSVRYFLLRPPDGGSATVRLGGTNQTVAPAAAGLRLRLLRLR